MTKASPSIALLGPDIITPGVLQETPMKVAQVREVTVAVAEEHRRRLSLMLEAQL